MAYFPAVVFLGKVKGATLVYGLLGELAWAVVLHRAGPRAVPPGAAPLQRLWRLTGDDSALGRYFRLLGSLGPVHA